MVKKHQKNNYDKKLSLLKKEHKDEFESWIDSEITWFLVENSTALNSGLILHIQELLRSKITSQHMQTQCLTTDSNRSLNGAELKYLNNLCNSQKLRPMNMPAS